MSKKTISLVTFLILFSFLFSLSSFSQTPDATQTTGGILQQEQQMKTSEELEQRVRQKKEKAEEKGEGEQLPEQEGETVLIEQINVEGVSLIEQSKIKDITSQYEGKEISLRTMQKIADLITDLYREAGYVTSRAYLPPQTIQDGILIIRVIEGELGSLQIQGNKYFKTSLLRKKITLNPGEAFDYSSLQRSLIDINEHPDRTARVVLMPGEQRGTTDVVLRVEDNLPFHVGYKFDNYGSRYIEKDRHGVTLEHNNLFGFDDKFYFMYQLSEYGYYEMKTARYTFPLTNTLDVGAYLINTDTKLGREFEDLDSRGEAEIYGVFANKKLINTMDTDLRLNLGFDYKDIENYLSGEQTSLDELRIAKVGLDLDVNDSWGRTIVTTGLDIGIPDIMGGMPEKYDSASRSGAAGKFYKGVFNLFRLQPGPFSSSILLKNQAQLSNYHLPASEEFQIGGPLSVRGYPVAEYAGDSGYYGSIEWSLPPYFISKSAKVPFSEDKIYDTFRTVLFYDWGMININNPTAGQESSETLKSVGFGFRLNLTKDFSARIELGYPLGQDASDGHNVQHWVQVNLKF
jgi:hemolysin activation/secretion protein